MRYQQNMIVHDILMPCLLLITLFPKSFLSGHHPPPPLPPNNTRHSRHIKHPHYDHVVLREANLFIALSMIAMTTIRLLLRLGRINYRHQIKHPLPSEGRGHLPPPSPFVVQ